MYKEQFGKHRWCILVTCTHGHFIPMVVLYSWLFHTHSLFISMVVCTHSHFVPILVVSYPCMVVSYPRLFCTHGCFVSSHFIPKFSQFVPSLSQFVPKWLVHSYLSQYTFIQNTSHTSTWTHVDCCVWQISRAKQSRSKQNSFVYTCNLVNTR